MSRRAMSSADDAGRLHALCPYPQSLRQRAARDRPTRIDRSVSPLWVALGNVDGQWLALGRGIFYAPDHLADAPGHPDHAWTAQSSANPGQRRTFSSHLARGSDGSGHAVGFAAMPATL